MTLFTIAISTVSAFEGEPEDFLAKLKTHYQNTLQIKTYSLNYHFLNKQYRSHDYWDYQAPDRVMSVRMVEVDMAKKQFYDNDILYSSSGRLNDFVQFQNDKESFSYERNGSYKGKRILNKGMGNFDRFISHNIMNVDFLAVRPLLEEINIKGSITLLQDSKPGTITLTHKTSDNNVIVYEFGNNPLQLVSINNKTRRAIYVYDDYQTTRGLTYARSVNKFYDGATVPAYISFNDKFDIIEKVDPTKLQVPPGYGPIIPERDGTLVSKEVAAGLYLVTYSSGFLNSLFKVNGNEIMVFGASGYPELAEETIKLIGEQFPSKKITSVYVTHPHSQQIGGLETFAKLGIVIHADEYSIAAIKAYPRFADDINIFKFQTIKHEQVMDGAHFYVLENMHSKRQSFVYFKDSGIIFQAHFLHIAFDNTIAKVIPNYTRTFIDFVRKKQLKVNRIVATKNNNNISIEVMNKTYDAIM